MTNNPLEIYVIIGSVSYTATEVLKAIIRIFFPKVKIGIIISAIFNLLFVYGFGLGIIGRVFNVEYSSTSIPILFQHMDLITTAFVLCLVNKGVDKIIDTKKIANAHLFTESIRSMDTDQSSSIDKKLISTIDTDVDPIPETSNSDSSDNVFTDLINKKREGEYLQIGKLIDPYDEFDEYEDEFSLSHMGGDNDL